MGEKFTGVINKKLRRLPAFLFAGLAVAAAAGMALIQPSDLVSELASPSGSKAVHPAVFCTAPNVLYRSKHIAGSVYAGPGSSAAGLAMLRQEAGKLPHDREIVIYCGCCPWDHCPNVQPAVSMLKEMGYTKVKALYLATGFKNDWIDKGYPIQ